MKKMGPIPVQGWRLPIVWVMKAGNGFRSIKEEFKDPALSNYGNYKRARAQASTYIARGWLWASVEMGG